MKNIKRVHLPCFLFQNVMNIIKFYSRFSLLFILHKLTDWCSLNSCNQQFTPNVAKFEVLCNLCFIRIALSLEKVNNTLLSSYSSSLLTCFGLLVVCTIDECSYRELSITFEYGIDSACKDFQFLKNIPEKGKCFLMNISFDFWLTCSLWYKHW